MFVNSLAWCDSALEICPYYYNYYCCHAAPALEAGSLNHWITREVPIIVINFRLCYQFLWEQLGGNSLVQNQFSIFKNGTHQRQPSMNTLKIVKACIKRGSFLWPQF